MSATTTSTSTTTPKITRSSSSSSSRAQITCRADNCLRNLQNTRSSSSVSAFCATYTTALKTDPAAIPTYLGNCGGNPSRVGAACSCIFPSSTPSTSSTSSTSSTCPPASVYNCPTTVSGFDGPDATYNTGQYTEGTEVQTFALTTETPVFASTTQVEDLRNLLLFSLLFGLSC
jgi:hypothetical protein